MKELECGGSIMADCGFKVTDLLPEDVQYNIWPFLDGRSQLEPEKVFTTRRIATLGIDVERAIERIKNFRITASFPISLCPLASHIISACTFLTLFQESLVAQITHTVHNSPMKIYFSSTAELKSTEKSCFTAERRAHLFFFSERTCYCKCQGKM